MPAAPPAHSDPARIDWRQVDATTDADIARQVAGDADTAPLLTATELLAIGRLAALRARAAASLADPAPGLSEAEADVRLAALFVATGEPRHGE
jgi:hypothetical protein